MDRKSLFFLIVIDSNVLNPFFKHNLDEPPCDITKNWCGWRSIRGWKRISHRDLEQQGSQESRADDNADSTNKRGTLCWVFLKNQRSLYTVFNHLKFGGLLLFVGDFTLSTVFGRE